MGLPLHQDKHLNANKMNQLTGSLADNPIRRVSKLLRMQEKAREELKKELIKEKEDECVSVQKFLRSDNIDATEAEIALHQENIINLYDQALSRF